MNQAVISCLHANLPAVEAVLKDIELQGITNITCLGDLVGYGPQPNEVIELIRDKKIPTCQGCWDEDVVDGLDACDCSYPSQLAEKRGHFAHQWTTDKLTKKIRIIWLIYPTQFVKINVFLFTVVLIVNMNIFYPIWMHLQLLRELKMPEQRFYFVVILINLIFAN